MNTRILWRYFLVTYVALLVNISGFLTRIDCARRITPWFVGTTFATYSLLYLIPLFLPMIALQWLLVRRSSDPVPGKAGAIYFRVFSVAAILGSTLVHIAIYADKTIYQLYGFHLNGFVWNLVWTPGGLESLGGSTSTSLTYALIMVGFLTLQTGLFLLVMKIPSLGRFLDIFATKKAVLISIALFVSFCGFEQLTYGLCSLRGYSPVLVASRAFPLYLPTTFTGLAKKMGYETDREASLPADFDSTRLNYPRQPLHVVAPAKPLNIVWLVAESWRADMLDEEIMPHTWAFAHRAHWFGHHYSAGNGTRMAMFGMFYGLCGSYWFPMLDAHRGPLLIDRLIDLDYRMEMFTSAKFTYPEFDRTIFSRIPPEHLHEGSAQPKWRRDRNNVDRLLKFVDGCDPACPFMTFMFFESPHANYYFPQDSIIREPYATDLNYATMDLQRDIGLIKNRYINACHYLDRQIGRILDHLEEKKLLDSTIVVITGDHGEAFMEKGRWGHNSDFSEQQTRAPLVLYIPGTAPTETTRMTSHLDIPATLLPLLGVTNPPEDYGQGVSLLDDAGSRCTVISSWNDLACVTPEFKVVFPLKVFGFAEQTVTTRDDVPVSDQTRAQTYRAQSIPQVMNYLKAFHQ